MVNETTRIDPWRQVALLGRNRYRRALISEWRRAEGKGCTRPAAVRRVEKMARYLRCTILGRL